MRVDPTGEAWAYLIVMFNLVLRLIVDYMTPRSDLANAPDLDRGIATSDTYDCYGNAIGKVTTSDPTGYKPGDSTRKTFWAVKNDLGANNVRELKSIDDPIAEDEFKVALRCGPTDFHFIRLLDEGWYNKSSGLPGVYIDQSYVIADVWYPMSYGYMKPDVHDKYTYYDDEIIYFAVKKGWDE